MGRISAWHMLCLCCDRLNISKAVMPVIIKVYLDFSHEIYRPCSVHKICRSINNSRRPDSKTVTYDNNIEYLRLSHTTSFKWHNYNE